MLAEPVDAVPDLGSWDSTHGEPGAVRPNLDDSDRLVGFTVACPGCGRFGYYQIGPGGLLRRTVRPRSAGRGRRSHGLVSGAAVQRSQGRDWRDLPLLPA